VIDIRVGIEIEIDIEIEYPEDYDNRVIDYLIYLKDGRLL